MNWLEIICPQTLNIILGRKRYGKSCLGYYILEQLHAVEKTDCFVYGLPREKSHLLPDHISPIYDLDLPEQSAILFDEAYIAFHARSSLSSANKAMDILAGLVGQKEIIALFITQQSRKLDVGVVSAADSLLFKMPSMLQARFERPEIRKLSKEIYELFKDISGDPRTYTYVICDDFEGFISNPAPSFWSEELSKAFAGVSVEVEQPKKEPESTVDLSALLKLPQKNDVVTSIEMAVKIHYKSGMWSDLSKVVAELLNTAAERIYEPKWESEKEGYDYFLDFSLGRRKSGDPFHIAGGRFKYKDLIEKITNLDVIVEVVPPGKYGLDTIKIV